MYCLLSTQLILVLNIFTTLDNDQYENEAASRSRQQWII